jgi:adenylyltransferase/sulfurtransferase
MFGPSGPCYECTLGEKEREMLSHRRSCALLAPKELLSGKTPTNVTTAAIVAGVQAQEAVKFLVGMSEMLSLVGKVWRYEGETMISYVTAYSEDSECLAHDPITDGLEVHQLCGSLTEIASKICASSNSAVEAIHFYEDLLAIEGCATCGTAGVRVGLRSMFEDGSGVCSVCDQELRIESHTAISLDNPLSRAEMREWLWPRSELIALQSGAKLHPLLLEAVHV